jgi:glycine/serine hydroxymethyltransferase
MGSDEMREIAGLIDGALAAAGDERVLRAVRAEVEVLCRRHPLYAGRWTESD